MQFHSLTNIQTERYIRQFDLEFSFLIGQLKLKTFFPHRIIASLLVYLPLGRGLFLLYKAPLVTGLGILVQWPSRENSCQLPSHILIRLHFFLNYLLLHVILTWQFSNILKVTFSYFKKCNLNFWNILCESIVLLQATFFVLKFGWPEGLMLHGIYMKMNKSIHHIFQWVVWICSHKWESEKNNLALTSWLREQVR